MGYNVKQELMMEEVFLLLGADVLEVLTDMGEDEIIEDPEELENLIKYIKAKVVIDWQEEVRAGIEIWKMRKLMD